MLRMTRSTVENVETLHLEGKLLAPWLGALRIELVDLPERIAIRRLNLAELSFVDVAGARALLEFEGRGVELHQASALISALLEQQRS